MQKQKYLLESVSDQTDILQLYGIDESTVVDLFLLLNEQSSFLNDCADVRDVCIVQFDM